MAKFWRFSGSGGQGLEKVSIFTAKGTSIGGSTSFVIFRVKIGWALWPPGHRLGKNKVTNIVYFTYLPRSLRCSDRHQICSGGWFPGRNQLCQISFQSVQGFWFCRGSNFGLSHRNEVSPLTQGLNYRSACDFHSSFCISRHYYFRVVLFGSVTYAFIWFSCLTYLPIIQLLITQVPSRNDRCKIF